MKILIVEDDFAQRRLLSLMLTSYGQVDVAMHGREAVSAVATALSAGSPYDLICLDIMMPEMDGLTALRRIRRLEEENGLRVGKRAHIIMTTALDDARSVLGAFQGECDAYLVKPFDRNLILTELGKLGLVPIGAGTR
jgi:two-component system chemotaxis response regulator CheY